MQVKSTEKLPDILSACSDGVTVYLLSNWHPNVLLSVLDSSSFKITNRFTMQIPFNRLIQPCADDDCIYVPTTDGNVLGVNKFEGSVLVSIDVGLMTLVSDIEQDNDRLYTLCGVPISNGIKTDTETFCICVNSKENGKKLFQSQSMIGQVCPIVVKDDIWSLIGKTLYQYSKSCELKNSVNLSFPPHYRPQITEDFVSVASNLGTLEIFRRNTLEPQGKLITEKNASPPLVLPDNMLIWFVGKKIYSINLATLKVQQINTLPIKVSSTPALIKNNIFVSDDTGCIIKLDDDHKIERISVDKTALRKPLAADEYVVTSTKEKIYFIEV